MAKSNQAKNLADVRSSKDDPISELSDIMKFDPVEASLEKVGSSLEIDLESELMGELSLVESEDGEDAPIKDASHKTSGIPGLDDDGPESLAAETTEDVDDEDLSDVFDEVFDKTMSEPAGDDCVDSGPRSNEAKVPPELESQLNALLAGLGGKTAPASKPDTDEELEHAAEIHSADQAKDTAPEPVAPPTEAGPEPAEDDYIASDPLADLADITGEIEMPEAKVEKQATPQADSAPLVETADIVDDAVALEDDLDIPDIKFEKDVPEMPDFDELDQEFTKAFSKLSEFDKVKDEKSSASAAGNLNGGGEPHLGETLDNIFAEMSQKATPLATASQVSGYKTASDLDASSGWNDSDHDDRAGDSPDDDFGNPPPRIGSRSDSEPAAGSGGAGRGILIAMIVAAIAVAGGIGAFALSFGGGDEMAAPALVKADDGPVKVKPKDPGGKTVPNEDKKVYERVAGTGEAETPTQEKLITTEEEPLDVAADSAAPRVVLPGPTVEAEEEAVEALPGVKGDDRILPEAEEVAAAPADETIAVIPKRVKTLIVRPDGTLVPREETEVTVADELRVGTTGDAQAGETAAATAPTDAADEAEMATATTEEVVGAAAANEEEVALLTPAAGDTAAADATDTLAEVGIEVEGIPFPTPAPRAEFEAERTAAAAAGESPAPEPTAVENQPADVTPEPNVTAIEPAAAETTEWWVQISSQPSRELAQASYAELASRYGSIIGGRGVNIFRADIEGKGTYYRVRVAGGSRNEAAELCGRLKSAGAGCFIAR